MMRLVQLIADAEKRRTQVKIVSIERKFFAYSNRGVDMYVSGHVGSINQSNNQRMMIEMMISMRTNKTKQMIGDKKPAKTHQRY